MRALVGLTRLTLRGSDRKSILSNLAPLQGLKLTHLECPGTAVKDLSPLAGMPLESLHCDLTRVRDLSPLRTLPLRELSLYQTEVTDLRPLRGRQLDELNIGSTAVSDLSPLEGMPLTSLFVGGSQVTDLSPLKSMPLKKLTIDATQVKDLSPLKGMVLRVINYKYTPVTDVTPLRGMPLEDVECSFDAQRDGEVLRSIQTLALINRKSAAAFWKEVAGAAGEKGPEGSPKEYTNSLKMKFMLIPKGKFTMGSPRAEIDRCLKLLGEKAWEKDRLPTEGPEHEVEISQPFYLGATEVTVGQFRQFVAANPTHIVDARWQNPGFEQTNDHPVVWVSWVDAVAFCAWLSEQDGKNTACPRRPSGSMAVAPAGPGRVIATAMPKQLWPSTPGSMRIQELGRIRLGS